MANQAVVDVIDQFGRRVVVEARDRTIATFDRGLAESGKPAPTTAMAAIHARKKDMKAIASLTPEQKDAVRRMFVQGIDQAVFNMLVLLHEERFRYEPPAALSIQGVEILYAAMDEMAWPGIFGGMDGEDGWYARFSKYGESGSVVPK